MRVGEKPSLPHQRKVRETSEDFVPQMPTNQLSSFVLLTVPYVEEENCLARNMAGIQYNKLISSTLEAYQLANIPNSVQ